MSTFGLCPLTPIRGRCCGVSSGTCNATVGLTVMLIGMPVVFLLLFAFVFGGTLGAGLGVASGGRADYINYVVPGILIMAVASVAQGTSISVAMDMTEGIIARFRTMAIFRPSVLTGHVLGGMIQTALSLVAVIVVALAIGFRPTAGPLEWIAAVGVLAMVTLALTWLWVALGLVAKSVETASNIPMPLIILPFLSSGFVPTESMPAAVRWFAEYQPFTPIIETLRGLLLGTGIGANAIGATAWCAAISLACFLWAKTLYRQDQPDDRCDGDDARAEAQQDPFPEAEGGEADRGIGDDGEHEHKPEHSFHRGRVPSGAPDAVSGPRGRSRWFSCVPLCESFCLRAAGETVHPPESGV